MDDLPKRGETCATTSREVKVIIKLFEEDSQLTLRNAQKELLKKKVEVSFMTIIRSLEESRLGWGGTLEKPLQKRNLDPQSIILGMDTLQVCLVSSWKASVAVHCETPNKGACLELLI